MHSLLLLECHYYVSPALSGSTPHLDLLGIVYKFASDQENFTGLRMRGDHTGYMGQDRATGP